MQTKSGLNVVFYVKKDHLPCSPNGCLQKVAIISFFFRQGLGTHSVPDIEVLSTDPPDLMPLTGASLFFVSSNKSSYGDNVLLYLSLFSLNWLSAVQTLH